MYLTRPRIKEVGLLKLVEAVSEKAFSEGTSDSNNFIGVVKFCEADWTIERKKGEIRRESPSHWGLSLRNLSDAGTASVIGDRLGSFAPYFANGREPSLHDNVMRNREDNADHE